MNIREKWDEIVKQHFNGDYSAADEAFPQDEESKQEMIDRTIPDPGQRMATSWS